MLSKGPENGDDTAGVYPKCKFDSQAEAMIGTISRGTRSLFMGEVTGSPSQAVFSTNNPIYAHDYN